MSWCELIFVSLSHLLPCVRAARHLAFAVSFQKIWPRMSDEQSPSRSQQLKSGLAVEHRLWIIRLLTAATPALEDARSYLEIDNGFQKRSLAYHKIVKIWWKKPWMDPFEAKDGSMIGFNWLCNFTLWVVLCSGFILHHRWWLLPQGMRDVTSHFG